MHKEGWSRLGFFGYDLQDQCGSANSMSIRPDEGLLGELRGPNYPNYAMNVGHQGEYAAIAGAAHYARGDAWTLSPLMKITFADPSLKFDFSEATPRVRKGCNPRVHARWRALTDHTSKVRSYQSLFFKAKSHSSDFLFNTIYENY